MKKILLLAIGASMFISNYSNAQNLKQSGGEGNLQVLFAPLGGQPISINGISYRKFNSTGNAAWRLNLFLGFTSSTDVITQPIDTGSFSTGGGRPEGDAKSSGMTISIRPGYEWHTEGTERLSPYCGVELLFSMTTAKVDSEYVRTNGSNTSTPTSWNVLTGTTKGDGASTSFGLNLVAGMDYYFTKNLSIGAELGFGFSLTTMPDIEGETIGNNKTTGAFEIVTLPNQVQGSSLQVGPNAVGQIRLGWLF